MIERRDNTTLAGAEEGIIKNNPLLGLSRHFSMPDNSFSDSCSSDTDVTPDIIQHHEDRKKNIHITSAMIHPPHNFEALFNSHPIHQVMMHQESIERLPEENVSIIETIEGREERPDTVKVIGTTRRKLYFNPAYFEPQLLLAPPPAAIEFLTKIREVISIAKQKMASKKFTPSLKGIPEEDTNYAVDVGSDYVKPIGSRRSSVISLKRENSRRKRCSGCPGCEPQDFKALSGKLPEFPSLAACHTCATTADNNKQISIRKWLEDIPVLKTPQNTEEIPTIIVKPKKITKRIRSPTRSLSPDYITPHIRTLSPRPASERARSPAFNKNSSLKSSSSKKSVSTVRTANSRRRKEIVKPKCPPPPLPTMPKHFQMEQNIYDVIAEPKAALPPPDMIHEAMAVDCKEDPKITTTTKKKMKAVINELSNLNVVDSSPELDMRKEIDYEADSLERSRHKGFSTPSDYAEVTSSQPSPSLSSALPMDEEMTMRNAIINTKTGNMTISKINMEEVLKSDDHDYELIVLKKGDNGNKMFKLPELLQRNSGYSLVSEVYVNNGYNYGSAPSTPSESNCSTMERAPKIIYEENKPGHLLIEVGDCADNYIKAEDSDNFEPDTLDRKPKMKIFNSALSDNEFVDSLERPTQIMLRTTGSFKKDSMTDATDQKNVCNFNRNFGSLREIYEAKVKKSLGEVNWRSQDFEGRILTLEERHCRRQRKSPTIQPDVIPPHREVSDGPIYEHPKPPRKVQGSKPPLPPKNGPVRSTEDTTTGASIEKSKSDYESCNHLKSDVSILKNFIHADDVIFKNGINNQFILQAATITTNPLNLRKVQSLKKEWRKVINVKPEDSGYLSTDSSDSHKKKMKDLERASAGSETDESLGDGHSESGAESIETHSVFFGSYRKTSCIAGSIDSGVGSDLKPTEAVASLEDHASSSDSETVSYSTVVTPLRANK
ncbi:PREDICTED: uncharacterized protein LOC108567950 [Nicrophorus vespilloides]|uniref:Uncharacterized protein LOC108567950 n=1 Tax=Nicrophorus vespilloides TaxID=110193 RepID=A0ABM1NBR0_NICVS|nr:PREDICTED: uncharacterized protein LOC108567950 [Nicrophorus vespilloides]